MPTKKLALAVLAFVMAGIACGPSGRPRLQAPRQIPIDHVVVLMQENRSFDHYLGQLRRFDPTLDVEPLPEDASNPDPANAAGAPIRAFHQAKLCEVADLDHSWNGTHKQWNSGRMDGFTKTNVDPNDPTGSRAMGYYNEQDLPYYYALYSTFAMGDRYFSSVLTQTFPNRFYLVAGTSFGHIRNDSPPGNVPDEFSQRSIFNLLDEAGITWKVYVSDLALTNEFGYVRKHAPGHVVPIGEYFKDAQASTLPQVAFIEPRYVGTKNFENDEHPPANVQVGQKFVADVIGALFLSPQWGSSALFLTYDEHGGYYDHVPPPPAPVPDDVPPMLESGDEPGAFDRYGIRVPAVVVSPFSKKHFVSHVPHDHASILRFIEVRFGLPAPTRRDASADPTRPLFFLFCAESP